MNIKYIIIVLGEPYSTFSEIIGKYFKKVKKFKKKIILSISKLCKINKDKINLKGKTAEKLGVIGKEKAIACEVIASIKKNYD